MQVTIEPDFQAAEIFRWNLRALMDQRGLTISALARLSGIHRPNVSRILAGKEGASMNRAEKLAQALGMPLSAIISRKF